MLVFASIMRKNWIRIVAVFIVMAAFLFFFLRSAEWKEVFQHLTDLKWGFFLLMVLIAPLHLLTRAFRWKYLLRHEKEGVSFYNRFASNAVGFTVSIVFPGRLGEVVKPIYLAEKEKMTKGFVLGTVVVERIFDIFTMCFILGLFLLLRPLYTSIFSFSVDNEIYSKLHFWGIGGLTFSLVLLFVIIGVYFFRNQTMSFITFCLRPLPHKVSEKVTGLLNEFIRGLKFFHSVGNLLLYIAWSFVVWLGIIIYYWFLFFSYDISLPYFYLFPYVFMTMIGASIPTPGMVGGFHYFSRLALISFYGVDSNLAVGMTLVAHTVQVVVTCLAGYVILWKEGLSLFQIKKIGRETKQ